MHLLVSEGKSDYLVRFGSIIAGAVQSKILAKREKREETKDYSEKKKHQRGSFSFEGGMQVIIILTDFYSLEECMQFALCALCYCCLNYPCLCVLKHCQTMYVNLNMYIFEYMNVYLFVSM